MSRLVTRSALGDQIFDILRERITRIQLAPGERLDIRGLAEEFGTSAIPVRDALKRLSERGLVTSLAGSGYNVIALSESDMESVSEFRMVLELLAVETSIDRIPTEVLSDLVGRNERLFPFAEKLNTSETVDDVDVELHTGCIVGYAANRYLKDTYDRLYDLISIAKNWLHRYPDVIVEHRAILESMLRRDLEATRKTLSDHLKKTSVECLRAMELRNAEGSSGNGTLGNAQEGSG
jgi:GntR family carbon starvation induced transcriptional regulator